MNSITINVTIKLNDAKTRTLSWSTFSSWPCRIPEQASVFSLPSIFLLVFPALSSVYDEVLQVKKESHPCFPSFFLVPPLTDNLSPAFSATMKNMLTFPRRALLWQKVMDLRPWCSSYDETSFSQRGAKLTVYLRLTLSASWELSGGF